MAGTLQILFLNPPAIGYSLSRCRRPTTHFPFSGIRSHLVSKLSSSVRASLQHSNKGNGRGDHLPQATAKDFDWVKPLSGFVSNNFLPLALIGGVALGLANPTLGCLADRYYLSKVSTFGIFIISGLTLRSDEVGAAAEAWPVGLFGLVSILFFTPFFSKIILLLKLQPQEFVTGLAIFSCMPTTLSSGVALTRLAGGNSALALAMTLMSNLLGILIVPFSISKLIAAGVGVCVPAGQLFRSLVLTLLVPLIIGKGLRECFKGVAEFSDRNRKLLSMMSSLLLSLAPFIQVSRSRSLLLLVKPAVFLLAVVLGVLLHLILFAFNALAIPLLSTILGGSESSFSKKQNISALLLVASQKTLPVMVAVVEQLGGALGESGLLVLPCIAAHLNQIILDSFLVSLWFQKENDLKTA
ncbi:putative sodium/metabolite cotransporter BASS4, chloroplastic [Capsicum annuum]|uniref:Probable sodium/metabolite cotransporter BASS4, chloroplastic n=1 Tax=Capsicum annuum TaxID=4072 RepID=A0A1U8HGM7_CAPAN|nr:probable sodium/metabolite cotransporter BASS4, chloroplastic isoform X2 [Capsicum annuum]KAF3672997.1 putative sodium/metabolite cotransporter BASS4, chloroplastic [Capsicum annuum]PHT75842.1 putative sodium/metabolite cotransporter BASS4, chloroplastic [Capsicum annuum]